MSAPYWLRKRGEYYQYFIPGRSTAWHSTHQTREGEAIKVVLKALKELPKADSPLLKDFTADFFKWGRCDWIRRQHAHDKPFGRANADSRRGHLVNHILPRFGTTPLSELTKADIESWLSGLPLSNQSRNHILYSFRIVLRDALDRKLVDENPLEHASAFGKKYRARDVFSAAELSTLFPYDEAKLIRIWFRFPTAVMFLLLASAGLRSGEVRALRWRHVLWNDRALLIDSAVKGEGEYSEIGATKTGNIRVAVLPPRTVEALEKWRGQSLFTDAEDLVFPGEGGPRAPLTKKTINARLTAAIKRAKIQKGERNLVVHSFRHTYATLLRAYERPLGHTTADAARLYDHPDVEAKLAEQEPRRKMIEKLFE